MMEAGVYKYLPTQRYTAYGKSQQVVLRITHIEQATFVVSSSGKVVLALISTDACVTKNTEEENPYVF